MTPTATVMTTLVVIAAVVGLLRSFRATLKRRRTLVVPDEQAYHTQIIRLRSPKKKNKGRRRQ